MKWLSGYSAEVYGIVAFRAWGLFTAGWIVTAGWEGLFGGLLLSFFSLPPAIGYMVLMPGLAAAVPRRFRLSIALIAGLTIAAWYFDWPEWQEQVYVSDWGPTNVFNDKEFTLVKWGGAACVALAVLSAWRMIGRNRVTRL
jgi:hypothetical protein